MFRNVAGQTIGAQIINATDGSAFTGAVSVYVTGTNNGAADGTQTLGTVDAGGGPGVCTHGGNGWHFYRPAIAETDFDHIAWTFMATGAVPVTVQTYTGWARASQLNAVAKIPTSQPAHNTLEIVRGDDYDDVAWPALTWTAPQDVTGATVTLTIRGKKSDDILATITGGTAAGTTVTVTLTHADTKDITPGLYDFDVQVEISGSKQTIALGDCLILEDQTRPA